MGPSAKLIPHSDHRKSPRRTFWVLLVSWLGILNFFLFVWSTTPDLDTGIYFWPIQFYSPSLAPLLSTVFFLISVGVILYWLSQKVRQGWLRNLILIVLVGFFPICLLWSYAFLAFSPALKIVGSVEQKGQVFYLVKYYDDLAFNFAFCESDAIGFWGKCEEFTWNSSSAADPTFSMDPRTDAIIVEFNDPAHAWRITTHPTVITLDRDG